jgi:hypothetical protein
MRSQYVKKTAPMAIQKSGFIASAIAPLPDTRSSPKPSTRGELAALSNARRRKKRVAPIAMRLMAIPITTWSARNFTVAIA